MACKLDLRDSIVSEANGQGVPSEIALAVAFQESGMCHWNADGSVLRGKRNGQPYEYGVMQLSPPTAVALGVNPNDVYDNIHGGVVYLRQLYDRYGDWTLAVQHYNGSGPAAQSYASVVMARARGYGFALNMAASSSPPEVAADNSPMPVQIANLAPPVISKNVLIGIGVVAGAGLLGFALAG